MTRRLHHIGMVVPSIEEAGGQLERWLTETETTLVFADTEQKVRVQFVRAGDGALIELIEPAGNPTTAAFLDRGGGLHHLAYEVDDFDGAVRDMMKAGRPMTEEWRGFENRRLRFFMPRSPLRLLVEIVGPLT